MKIKFSLSHVAQQCAVFKRGLAGVYPRRRGLCGTWEGWYVRCVSTGIKGGRREHIGNECTEGGFKVYARG